MESWKKDSRARVLWLSTQHSPSSLCSTFVSNQFGTHQRNGTTSLDAVARPGLHHVRELARGLVEAAQRAPVVSTRRYRFAGFFLCN